ncbi:ANR family transcriptional regulator [Erwinia psidii]|uniref:ANR family transcriptional regulator n=1 Tax=Erwinia psidii TaxID=69224 RepID=UPI00226B1629|nr:ANR family transcriptional regulator [Erwinia psidii]MCX8962164.1 ANR family transcriptional regulator [Erwinia psidii]
MGNNPARNCRGNQYARFANDAAAMEREGNHAYGFKLWLMAAGTPVSKTNQDWAAARADRCAYVAKLKRHIPYAGSRV